MIKSELYCYFDRKSHIYGAPFCAVNSEVAKRIFASMIQERPDSLAIIDTELYKIGEFDQDSAQIIGIPADFVCDYYGASELLGGKQ